MNNTEKLHMKIDNYFKYPIIVYKIIWQIKFFAKNPSFFQKVNEYFCSNSHSGKQVA